MSELIHVKETRYPNKCKACGEPIPKGSECYWEKGSKNNYHVQCKPTEAKAPVKPQAKLAETEEPLVMDDYDINNEFVESKEFIERNFGEEYQKAGLVEEHSRQKFAMWMSQQIQKNKRENMERISR
jgi:hypothetical protein